jgi:hypothetical protein
LKTGLPFRLTGCILFYGGFAQAEDAIHLRLVVEVRNVAGFEAATITSAEHIVTSIFRRLGVQVAWREAADAGRAVAGPDVETGRPDIWINLVAVTATRIGAATDKGGLAAVPGDGQTGSRIWVFRPILETVIDNNVYLTPQKNPTRLRNVLLAHVMAHEMGHLLLGSTKHSGLGIMTRELDLRAIRLACTGSLEFSATECGKIRATVQRMKETATTAGDSPMYTICGAQASHTCARATGTVTETGTLYCTTSILGLLTPASQTARRGLRFMVCSGAQVTTGSSQAT